MDAGELDLEDLPPKALRKLIKSILAKANKPSDDKESDKSDEEREALADLHESHKGKPKSVPVTEEDLPEGMLGDEEEEEGEDAEQSAVEPAAVPLKKKGK
jgi:hypothetical protein